MDVIKPGSRVSLPQAEIVNATVRQVCIAEDGLTYQVVWWSGMTRNEAWVAAYEVSADQPAYVPVGFVVPKRAES